MLSFGLRLRQERLRRHLSQEALAEALGISPRSIRRWEQEQAIPQASLRLQLSNFFGLRPEDFFEPAPLLWSIPYPRNPFFTGREDILQALHDRLILSQPVALTQSPALTGLGGIGKTQVAIEYAYRYQQEYSAVFWLRAETTESLMNSLQDIANLLQLPEHQQEEQLQMVKAVQRWLSTHADWLVIGDNIEELDLLQSVIPLHREGSMLFTTRRQALGMLAEPLELTAMDKQEGVELLLRRAKRFPSSLSADALPVSASNISDAEELVKQLGGLPLALDQAGAYLEETGCSITDYLQRYHHQRPQLLGHRGLHGGAHPMSVTATLQLSVKHIEPKHPAAIELLRACACLYADAIPEELLVAGAPHLGSHLQQTAGDAYQFDIMLSVLRSASLIERYPDTHTLSIHRLTQAVLQDWIGPTAMQQWSERMVRVLAANFPEPDLAAWPQCERLLQSVLACVQWLDKTATSLPEVGSLLSKAGNYLLKRGRFDEAESVLARAVALTEQHNGSDHVTLIPLFLLQSELFHLQGKYGQEEHLLQRTLVLCEQQLGTSHPMTAEALNNLANTYHEQGKYEQAEPLFYQALHIQEQQQEFDQTEIANTLNNLALLYRDQEKFEQAEKLFRRALLLREQRLGKDHPVTAITLNNLAIVYRRQQMYERAEPLYQQALQILTQQLGPEHPITVTIISNLANVYRDQEKYEQAEPLYQQALRVREQQLGTEHPDVALTLANLATLYREQKKYKQAEDLYQRALSLREQALGPEHPEIARTLQDLAILQEMQGKWQETISLYQRALTIREAAFGLQHPQTNEIRTKLQSLSHYMNNTSETISEEER
ncbi:tetratricopeptide repeat protein [Reticulibacter mediterranei]|uniref:Tetratricopeptide repeat protein n=1 Tax=Reticulibacter mediterranei TaxID=2778369 RepID=A0A8J3IDM2_9CHLR|nr:FxSxx-COOH system tetratricopeptide repeat protein [Reticulibacter mediterranei]GHO90628.1 tetratricopeptide repeat protein [Reticulibacter mediterranei]